MGRRRKKQVPRCARNDNSRAFGRAVRPLVGLGLVEGYVGVIRSADSSEAEKARGVGVRERGSGRAGRGSRGCS